MNHINITLTNVNVYYESDVDIKVFAVASYCTIKYTNVVLNKNTTCIPSGGLQVVIDSTSSF